MLKLSTIITKKGVYLSDASNRYNVDLSQYLINGEVPERSWNNQWYKSTSIPTLIQINSQPKNINYRYELKDVSFHNEKIPLSFKPNLVSYTNEDGDVVWHNEFRHLQSMYELKFDVEPPELKEVEFEITSKITYTGEIDFKGFSYPVDKENSRSNATPTITEKAVTYEMLEHIIFPSLLLPQRPCKLNSVDSYKIIRYHVKANIDTKQSSITSDYDFCFTVKKNIKLYKPYNYKKDVSSFRAKKPKYVQALCTDRQVTIFEMTHDRKCYDGYPIIKGFEGNDIEDLMKNIDTFLKDLMDKINEPLIECPCCEGRGVTTESEINKQ